MQDAFGNTVLCTSTAAVHAYDRAVDSYLHALPGVLEATEEALAHDPGFALAHVLSGLAYGMYGRGDAARKCLSQAREGIGNTNNRERKISPLASWGRKPRDAPDNVMAASTPTYRLTGLPRARTRRCNPTRHLVRRWLRSCQMRSTMGCSFLAERWRRISSEQLQCDGPAATRRPSARSRPAQLSGSHPKPWPSTTMALSASAI
jgi:hypothetical protein